VNFGIGDAEQLTNNDDHYDYAIMALVLFFVPNPDKGVAEMIRVCKSQGKIAAYVWDVLGHGFPVNPIHQIFAAKGIPVLVPPRSEVSTKDALRLVFEKNGAKRVETATFKVERTFDSYEEYWSLSSKSNSVFPALKNLDPKLIDEVKNELKANLDIDQQGRVKATAHANAVKGYVG
jgi:ubiquinone/menaquinone biosynthesis C-methylase UbiE